MFRIHTTTALNNIYYAMQCSMLTNCLFSLSWDYLVNIWPSLFCYHRNCNTALVLACWFNSRPMRETENPNEIRETRSRRGARPGSGSGAALYIISSPARLLWLWRCNWDWHADVSSIRYFIGIPLRFLILL